MCYPILAKENIADAFTQKYKIQSEEEDEVLRNIYSPLVKK